MSLHIHRVPLHPPPQKMGDLLSQWIKGNFCPIITDSAKWEETAVITLRNNTDFMELF